MKNIIIVIITIVMLSNCSKTDGFNLATDLEGTWNEQNYSLDNIKLYRFDNKGNLFTTIICTIEDDSDSVPTALYNKYVITSGANIEIYSEIENKLIGNYLIISNKDKSKIILKDEKNNKTITLIKYNI